MPEISRFLGLVIRMHFDDHEPPHFHVQYGEARATVRIDPPGLLAGDLPPRVLALAVEWASVQEVSLLDNWRRLRRHEQARPISPLE